MKIQSKSGEQGIEFVSLDGELDFHSAQDLRSGFMKLVDRKVSKILVDFKKVSYIDSSGLAAFVELYQRLKQYNGKLVLFNLTEDVQSVFEVAKLDSIFQLAKSEKEALPFLS